MRDHRAKPRGTREEIKKLCGVQTSPCKQLELQRPDFSPGTSGFANWDLKTAEAQPFLAISPGTHGRAPQGSCSEHCFPWTGPRSRLGRLQADESLDERVPTYSNLHKASFPRNKASSKLPSTKRNYPRFLFFPQSPRAGARISCKTGTSDPFFVCIPGWGPWLSPSRLS